MVTSDSASRSLRLLIELGRGGMGVVYLALAEGPGGFAKLKVIKRLRPDLAGESAAVQMFLEEGRLSARLRHPNVVQTNEAGFDGEHYFLEMEYLEGQSLAVLNRRASTSGDLPLPLALHVLGQTLAGLHYAHELLDHDGNPLSVVHRDVSPHNVFVTYEGEVKVLDFGIAKAAGSTSETKTGFVKGKVTYMAPEQVARQPLDRRVDIFAVGVMLWETLAGARLWGDLDDFEIYLKLRSDAIRAPSSVRANVPEGLEAICMRALSRNPDERYATAAEMQHALEGWIEANGDRVGPRELAASMGSLFAEDRATTKAQIEAQRRTTPAAGTLVGIPMLPARRRSQLRGLRGLVLASLGIAVVAIAAVGAAALRSRRVGLADAPTARAAAPAECAKNADCAKGSICRKEQARCVALATDRCTVLAEEGDVENERTIWIGAMFPTSGAKAALFGVPSTRALDLARRDFVAATRGIPSHVPGEAPRPLGIIACDDVEDQNASARHLAEDVGISAVVGFRSGAEAIELARDVFIPRRVFVATVNPSAQVTQVPQPSDEPRFVWRTTAVSTLNAVPAGLVVSDLIEPRLRKAGIVTDAQPMRVVFARPKSQYGLSMAEAMGKALSFNGRPALANGDKFSQLVYDDPYAPGSHPDFKAIVEQIADLEPHVVIYADQEQLVSNVFQPVERTWRAKAYRPYWVSVTDLAGKELLAFLGADAGRRHRFFGVSAPENSPANEKLAARYSAQFETISVNDTPAAAYDAAYLVAYAVYAVTDEAVTGSALARAVPRLIVPGRGIDVGPAQIVDAIGAIGRGEGIDLAGADTKLAFDLATGEPRADRVVQCIGVDPHGRASDAVESGLMFDVATGMLRGEAHCP